MRAFDIAGARGNLYAQRAKEMGSDSDCLANLHEVVEWEEIADARLGSFAVLLLYATPIVAIKK